MDLPPELSEIEYHLLVAEFDLLWSRRPEAALRERMDQMMRRIEAFEAAHASLFVRSASA
ncbi:hypothetical protein I5R65_09495 [Herbaspirillum sp. AP02]|uniref:hypothetical protein n=1 Tax=unclassified Herbaspirillum TaxID=2624150 RepID=UPI0015DB0F65|nr:MULTISPECIES: hypothetical protein [unclassified Herbaspirillum]MBG7619693.1 hypothetical protein [Herbaspirillum sp. AP02]NZD69764.1 hypothetical protein [Herbaspirillum sp. AP21]